MVLIPYRTIIYKPRSGSVEMAVEKDSSLVVASAVAASEMAVASAVEKDSSDSINTSYKQSTR